MNHVSLEFVLRGPINDNPQSSFRSDNGLARLVDKSLSEPMVVGLLTHI